MASLGLDYFGDQKFAYLRFSHSATYRFAENSVSSSDLLIVQDDSVMPVPAPTC
jgi:hypothetical protein